VPSYVLLPLLAVVLVISAVKAWGHQCAGHRVPISVRAPSDRRSAAPCMRRQTAALPRQTVGSMAPCGFGHVTFPVNQEASLWRNFEIAVSRSGRRCAQSLLASGARHPRCLRKLAPRHVNEGSALHWAGVISSPAP
jgi:hypothetical protein